MVFLEDIAKDPLASLEGIFSFLGLDLVDPEGEKVRSAREGYYGTRGFNTVHVIGSVKARLKQAEPELSSFFGDSTSAKLGGY